MKNKNSNNLLCCLLSVMVLAVLLALAPGCKSPNLELGGAYHPAVTNSTTAEVTEKAPADKVLFVSDAAYRLAYDSIMQVMAFERHNRAQLQAISPNIKTELDKLRPKVVELDRRWALARSAYLASPTPSNLGTLKGMVEEVQKLLPVVQSQLSVK